MSHSLRNVTGDLSTIAPTYVTGPESYPPLLLRGLDSLYVSYYVDFLSSQVDWDDLAYRKEKIGRERRNKFDEILLGSERFALQPYGKHPYKFVLSNAAFKIQLSERMQPSCYVQFYSEALWVEGRDLLTARFRHWVGSIGASFIKPETVSRADWAFDFGVPERDFEREHFVSRATKDASWREHQAEQTIQFGTGDVVLRVYDKVAEIDQQSDKAWFFDLWGQKTGVWRVEFQVRGERLKMGAIHTMDDLTSLEADLLRELATNHTTLRKPSGDSNRSRWPRHPLWIALLDAISSMSQTGLIQDIDPLAAIDLRLDRSSKATLGYLKNIGAMIQLRDKLDEPPSLETVIATLPKLLRRHHNEIIWNDDIARKVKGYELGQ